MTNQDRFIQLFETHIRRDGSADLLEWLKGTDFFVAPSSTRFHGACEGGLCRHSIYVWNHLLRLLKAYPEIRVSAETAAIVSLLHDVCKVGCYKTEFRNKKNELGKWMQVPFYTFREDEPFGYHGCKSVIQIQKFMRLTDEETVSIANHMGFSDRSAGDYALGEAYKRYPLALLVHVADSAATFMDEADA